MRDLNGVRVLITGGAGMIGSNIAIKAVERGAEVTIFDNMLPMYGGSLFNLNPIMDRIGFIYGDIREENEVAQVVRDKDIIFNLAAQVSYVDSNVHPLFDLDINCKGHLVVLESCRKYNPAAKIIFSSSRFVYGATQYTPVDEGHPYNCLSIYGVHKLNGEKYYQYYNQNYKLDTFVFRIANPYGPRQQMKHSQYGIVNWFIRLALEGKPLTIFGDGMQRRDYIYVEDIAEGMLSILDADNPQHRVFNLGSGTGTPFTEMADIIAKTTGGTRLEFLEWPKERYFVETGDFIANIERIKKATGWEPKTSLAEGIRKTIDYYRQFKEHYWK
jgi:nucleoside-diphosphate-sugar epimerase